MNLGFSFFVIQISAVVIFQLNYFLITYFFSPSEVAIYYIAFKYFSVITMFFSILVSPFWSAITDAYVRRDIKWIKETMHKLRLVFIGLTLIIIIMLLDVV